MTCYNCGVQLDGTNKTKEHIPAQALYVGYDESYKVNRITVPACRACNEKFSKTDQEIRDAIGMSHEDVSKAPELIRKSATSILRKKNNPLYFDKTGKLSAVSFLYNDFKASAIKDFKGVYYKKYGKHIPYNWPIEIIADFEPGHDLTTTSLMLLEYLDKDTNWSVSGHEDIFRYKLKAMIPDDSGSLTDGSSIEDAVSFVSIQEYHLKFGFIVVAKTSRLDSLGATFGKKAHKRG